MAAKLEIADPRLFLPSFLEISRNFIPDPAPEYICKIEPLLFTIFLTLLLRTLDFLLKKKLF